MEERINVAEILKDCPSGMELDCAIWDNCTFEGIEDVGYINILVKTPNGLVNLSKEGYLCHNNRGSKCVIFPKGKNSWEGFVPPCKFKDGDIVYTDFGSIAILKITTNKYYSSYCGLFSNVFKTDVILSPVRFATEEEKQKLFDVIKANGYKWDSETKTLAKLVKPKFKVGDKVIKKGGITIPVLITNVGEEFYSSNTEHSVVIFSIKEQDHYELVPNKFDINTLKPFDTVLVKSDNSAIWECDFFSSYNPNCSNKFHCIGAWYNICIPYKNNEHLLGTTNDCSEYYKTWE